MRRSVLGWVFAAVLAVAGSALAYVWFAGGSGEPTRELTTPPVAGATTTLTPGNAGSASPSTTEPPTERAFVIDPGRSTASFEVDEQLRGSPNQVVGVTSQIAGQVLVNPDDVSGARFSQIVVNARTLETDSARRDRAIRGPVVLNSARDEFELITFDVTSSQGFEGAVAPGETMEFTITGDLTVRGTTNEVTFDVRVTLVDPVTIEGVATAMVLRTDFGIGIPSVPGVANVGDEVVLKLNFVAQAA